MRAISQGTGERNSFWSFAFAIAVVVIHCSWTAETEIGRLSVALLRDTLARMAVSFFSVCSGFFLARHFGGPGWWRREVGKRIVSLVLPYLVWTLALALLLLIEAREVMGLGGFGLNLCKMLALAPLWYIRCLMILIVLSPLFGRLVDRFGLWSLVLPYVAHVAFASVLGRFGLTDECGLGGFLCYGFSLEFFFYFLAGIWICRKGIAAVSRRTALAALAGGCALIVLRLSLLHGDIRFAIDLRCLLTPLVLVGLWRTIRPPRLPAVLVCCAFPVYMVHGLAIAALRYAGGAYHVCNPWMEFAVGVIVPILFANAIRRWVPQTCRVLFGGRC